VGPIATCATPDLLLKHSDKILATYVQKQLKYLQHTSQTLLCKTPGKTQKHVCSIVNIYNTQMEHLQYTYETHTTLKTYACNMHVYATSRSTSATSI
jgi:hypothetical protein